MEGNQQITPEITTAVDIARRFRDFAPDFITLKNTLVRFRETGELTDENFTQNTLKSKKTFGTINNSSALKKKNNHAVRLLLNRSPINYHVTLVFRASRALRRPKLNPNP